MTVEELLEIEEIKQLRIMYSHYLDGGDLEGLVGLFCEDAVCEFGENYGGDWVGRETIRKNYSSYTSDEIKPFSMFMHAVTNPWNQREFDRRSGPQRDQNPCKLANRSR